MIEHVPISVNERLDLPKFVFRLSFTFIPSSVPISIECVFPADRWLFGNSGIIPILDFFASRGEAGFWSRLSKMRSGVGWSSLGIDGRMILIVGFCGLSGELKTCLIKKISAKIFYAKFIYAKTFIKPKNAFCTSKSLFYANFLFSGVKQTFWPKTNCLA